VEAWRLRERHRRDQEWKFAWFAIIQSFCMVAVGLKDTCMTLLHSRWHRHSALCGPFSCRSRAKSATSLKTVLLLYSKIKGFILLTTCQAHQLLYCAHMPGT
jgi:hypothetical protein